MLQCMQIQVRIQTFHSLFHNVCVQVFLLGKLITTFCIARKQSEIELASITFNIRHRSTSPQTRELAYFYLSNLYIGTWRLHQIVNI